MREKRQPDIKIYVCMHKPFDYIRNGIIEPIQIGAAASKISIDNMAHDDTGDNRSARDIEYGELTAQYWAWKNVKADYYGFFHYRRYFNFTDIKYPETEWGVVTEDRVTSKIIGKYGLDEETITRALEGQDIILGRKIDVSAQPSHCKNLIDQYSLDEHMAGKKADIECLMDVINDIYPAYYQYAYSFFQGKKMSMCNMFIMKRALFNKYCNWLFNILDEFERRCNKETYDLYASRTPGFMGERLLNIFCLYEQAVNNIKIKELQIVMFLNVESKTNEIVKLRENSSLIITSSGDYYAPYVSVWLQSIIACAKEENKYDIVILEENISDENKRILRSMVAGYSNFQLFFIDVSKRLNELAESNWNHTNRLTFARFLIPELFDYRDKALWVDSDLVFTRDAFDLFNEDINDYYLAAVKDIRSAGELNYPGDPQMDNFTHILKLDDPFSYFQAGVMVLNLKKFRENFTASFLLKEAQRTDLRWLDQDILNMQCQGNIKFLSQKWNTLVPAHIPIETFAPVNLKREYDSALADPWVVHYAGKRLPVYVPKVEYFELFWKYARNTPYYELLIVRMIQENNIVPRITENTIAAQPGVSNELVPRYEYVSGARKWADKWLPKGSRRRNLAKKILPKGSRRWEFFRKLYNKATGVW